MLRIAGLDDLATTETAAAILGQVAQQLVHRRVIGRVINEAPVLTRPRQPGHDQLFEVKAEPAIGLDPERLGDPPDRQALAPGPNQQAENLQTRGMRQSTQRGNGSLLFHISIIIEINEKDNSKVTGIGHVG